MSNRTRTLTLAPHAVCSTPEATEVIVEFGFDEFTVTKFADGTIEIMHFSDDTRESEEIDTDHTVCPDGLLEFVSPHFAS